MRDYLKELYTDLLIPKVHKNIRTCRRPMESGSHQIGNNCFFNNDCSLAANKLISIGDGTIMGENVKIYDHNHRFNKDELIKELGYSNGEVFIGKNCWIGSNAVILKGTHISNHCVIGAGCVISGYVPEWTIVKKTDNYQMCPIEQSR